MTGRYMMKLLLLLLLALPLTATSAGKLSVGAGLWGLFDDQDIQAAHLSFELKPQERIYNLSPSFTLIHAEGGDNYFALGLNKRLTLGEHFEWGVGTNIGLLNHSEQLGHKLEFYTKAFVGYKLSAHSSIELEIGHISNAGFGDINPGSESLVLSYTTSIE